MFAIKITAGNNLEKIMLEMGKTAFDELRIDFFCNRPVNWYLVQGYYNTWGQPIGWAILPERAIKNHFEHNPDVIQTDWDQIVRKAE